MPQATTIAHLSDVHLTPLRGFTPRHWNVKRTLGLINWHRGRKSVHRHEVVDWLIADLASLKCDHIAVTGDLCNIGLPGEYSAALSWLQSIGPPDSVSVVPGNHDIYSRLTTHPGVGLWHDYMSSDAFGAAIAGVGAVAYGFPYVRRVGCIALVGVNSAVETRPFVAAGKVGREQRAAVGRVLAALSGSGLARVVLIHHPPLASQAPGRRQLSDANQFEDVLREHGAELVLHGHNHRDSLVWCQGERGPIPIVGIASGSAGRRHRSEPLARYNLIRVRGDGGRWAIEITGRGLVSGGVAVAELDRQRLEPAE
ncbi:MAG: metallophosphoesterase [Hyphomicrobiaceae bacterium]|nr:metallophosphoesterase [Hyphomicrobiaceae bacterium]